jgi:diguanylate cyclase (GGDEF)-like protein
VDAGAAANSDYSEYDGRPVLVAAAVSLTLGTAVVLGWTFDVAVLKSVLPGWAPMKANAAIGFLLLGTVLLTCHIPRPIPRWIALAAGAMLAALCGATLFEYALNWNLGIDELLFREELARPTRLFQPGRMSPLSAASFLLLLAAMALSRVRRPWSRWLQQFCLFAPLLVSTRTLVGFLYGVPALCQRGQWGPMALHMTIALEVVTACLLLARPDNALAVLLHRGAIGSRIVRRVLLGTIAAILVLGLACLIADRAGLFQIQYGITLLVVLLPLVLTGLSLRPCRFINQLDRQHELAARAARRFRQASELDALTGLFNRRGFLDRAEQELSRTRLSGGRLTCLVLDIDFFKKINDAHGHHAGDRVLCRFAAILKAGCREGDLVGRMGGEEFCILLPATEEQHAMRLAEDLRVQILNEPFAIAGADLAITASGGIAELRPSHPGIHSLIDSADTALLAAKRTGRNRVLMASSLEEAELSDANRGPLGNARAQDIMLPAVACVRCDSTLEQAARQLVELRVDSLPVVDNAGKVQGLITEQDLVSTLLDPASAGKRVEDGRHTNVVVFEESTPADEIAAFFARTSIQRVVIVRDAAPVGVVSRRTLLRWLLNAMLSRRPFTPRFPGQEAIEQEDDIERAIRNLTASVSRLARLQRADESEPFAPSLVGEATRIQHFVETLLARSRAASPTSPPADLVAVGAAAIG